jgi:hypothetical protein
VSSGGGPATRPLLDWYKQRTPGLVVKLLERVEGFAGRSIPFDFHHGTGWTVPPMMATFYLAVLCSIILVVVSLLKPHQHTAESEKLVWDNPIDALRDKGWKGVGNYKFLAALLFVVMILLYIKFSIKP